MSDTDYFRNELEAVLATTEFKRFATARLPPEQAVRVVDSARSAFVDGRPRSFWCSAKYRPERHSCPDGDGIQQLVKHVPVAHCSLPAAYCLVIPEWVCAEGSDEGF